VGEDISAAPSNAAGEPAPEQNTPADAGASELDAHDAPVMKKALTAAEIEKRLTLPLERVEFTNVPLAQFAAFVGDVSGVPVVLDETPLAHAGKNRKTPVSIKLNGTTAAAALRAASQQAGLIYTIEDGRILISAKK
jgi:hypothetical protein